MPKAMSFEFSRKPTQGDIKLAKEKYKEVCLVDSHNKDISQMTTSKNYILSLWE